MYGKTSRLLDYNVKQQSTGKGGADGAVERRDAPSAGGEEIMP